MLTFRLNPRVATKSAGGKRVAVDPAVISSAAATKLSEKILAKGGAGLFAVHENLVDLVWGAERPPRPKNPVRVHDIQFAGQPFTEKLDNLRKELDKKNSAGLVVSMLDEIAWLFNLRGTE